MVPGDRLICTFLEQFAVGDTFKDWPLHITIIPWFRTSLSSDELAERLKEKVQSITPFSLTVLGEAGFGYKGSKLVNLIAQPSPLDSIEKQVRDVLHEYEAWIVDETNNFKRHFRPHITENKSGRAHQGETYSCDALYIIEQKGEYKEIASQIL